MMMIAILNTLVMMIEIMLMVGIMGCTSDKKAVPIGRDEADFLVVMIVIS